MFGRAKGGGEHVGWFKDAALWPSALAAVPAFRRRAVGAVDRIQELVVVVPR